MGSGKSSQEQRDDFNRAFCLAALYWMKSHSKGRNEDWWVESMDSGGRSRHHFDLNPNFTST